MSAGEVPAIEASREHCRKITRGAAQNFYYGLKLLAEPKRSAMYALYAYMRLVDDIADADDGRSAAQRVEDLERWREQTKSILNGRPPTDGGELMWPSFYDTVHRFGVPAKVFDAIIAGQEQDLEGKLAFQTFEELERYCYRVAGVVGLASIYVWGFAGGEATEQLALHRGTAFQLTNILRDLREDAGKGRFYLPRGELAEHGVTEEQIRSGAGGERFDAFMRFQIERAYAYYERSAELEQRVERDSRPTLVAMTQIYRGLLDKIAADPRRVLRERVSLSLWAKLRIGWKAVRAK